MSIYPPNTGNAEVNAILVSAAPFSRPHHAPVTTKVSPVNVQIIIVSMKVPVMEISPCSAGHFVFADQVPAAVMMIIESAFNPTAAAGGFLGATVMMAIRNGVARGVFSNESGLGSAPDRQIQ